MFPLRTGRRPAIKASLLPLLFLLLPPAILFENPAVRTAFFSLLTLYLSGRLYSGHIRKNITVARMKNGDCLFYGEEDKITLIIKNRSYLPAINILINDHPDFQLNFFGRQRFLITLPGRSVSRVQYKIKGNERGQFALRNRSAEASDFFGQFPWKTEYPDQQIVTVYPRIFPFSGFYRTYRQPFGSIRNKYPIFEEPSRMEGIRPFQSGDERRRINWKQSARTGKLLVNQYMPSISQKTFILLNQYSGDYDFRYREFYSELALEIAVSSASRLISRDQECGIQVSGELRSRTALPDGIQESRGIDRFRLEPGSGGRTLRDILHLLAGIHLQDTLPFLEELHPGILNNPHNTSLLIITPDLDPEQCARIGTLKQQGLDPAVFLFGPNFRTGYGLKRYSIPLFRIRRDEGILRVESLK